MSIDKDSIYRFLEEMDRSLDLESFEEDSTDGLTGTLSEWEENGNLVRLTVDESALALHVFDGYSDKLLELWTAPRRNVVMAKRMKNKVRLIEELDFEPVDVESKTALKPAIVLESVGTEDRPYPRVLLSDGSCYYITESIEGKYQAMDKVMVNSKRDGTCTIIK